MSGESGGKDAVGINPGSGWTAPLSTLRLFLSAHTCFAEPKAVEILFLDFEQERLWLVKALC